MRDRRVTVGRTFSLLVQGFLACFTFRQIYEILHDHNGAGIPLVIALATMIIAILHGAMGLPGMLKAALGSIAYRVALIFSGVGIALVSAAFLLVFILPAAGVLPAGFFYFRAGTPMVTLEGGVISLIAFGAAILMTTGYAYGAGMISALLLFRSKEKLQEHWMFKDLDRQSDWDLPDL